MIAPGLIRRMAGCAGLMLAPWIAAVLIPPHNGLVMLPILIGALVILFTHDRPSAARPFRAQAASGRAASVSAQKKEPRP